MKSISILFFFLFALASISAQNINVDSLKTVIKQELKEELDQEQTNTKRGKSLNPLSKMKLNGYGVVNYYNYGRFDTDPGIRDKVDAERLNLYFDYQFNDRIILHTEIEFEHGGTGSTLELDVQEEFGEFEHEIEQGGEVNLEQLHLEYRFRPYLNIVAGKFKLYFNLAQLLDEPDEYFTIQRPEMENVILPLGWYETGIGLHGMFLKRKLSYRLALVNGLESTGFSSANWIKLGYQTKFEMVNAENFALFGNLNYHFGKNRHTLAGISYYYGNTNDNRPKPDLEIDSHVKIIGAHVSVFEAPFRFASQFIYGDLQNSERIALRNATLPKTLGIKKTPVAKNALGISAEIGYDILSLTNKNTTMELYPFVRYEFYDTMYKTTGKITANKRWERSVATVGINWLPYRHIVVKAQYTARTLGADNIDISTGEVNGKEKENFFGCGIGFQF
ncbi:MAG: autotransporter outer membrane beta-barrel domain-containing protein [Xanthomarina gelatinilytica]|uniref:autotransporter outer membrane beta-barrel domain-containing protein n=1 Tax=Xanthomarina gelatinilytica TaxID=1137281 RepID=UPI003A8A6F34